MSGEVPQKLDISVSRRTVLKAAGVGLLHPVQSGRINSVIESTANPALLQTRVARRIVSPLEPVLPEDPSTPSLTTEEIFQQAIDNLSVDQRTIHEKAEQSVFDRLRGDKPFEVAPLPEDIPNSIFIGEIDRFLSQSKNTKKSQVMIDPDRSVNIRALTIPDGDNSLSLSIITPAADKSNSFQLVHMTYQIGKGDKITLGASFTSNDEYPRLDQMGIDLTQDQLGVDQVTSELYKEERRLRGYDKFNARAWFETLIAAEAQDTGLGIFPVISLGERILSAQNIAEQLQLNREFQVITFRLQQSTEPFSSTDLQVCNPRPEVQKAFENIRQENPRVFRDMTVDTVDESDTDQDLLDAEQDYRDGKYTTLEKEAILKKISKPSLRVGASVVIETAAALSKEASFNTGIELNPDQAQDFLVDTSSSRDISHKKHAEVPDDVVDAVMDALEEDYEASVLALPSGDSNREEQNDSASNNLDREFSLN